MAKTDTSCINMYKKTAQSCLYPNWLQICGIQRIHFLRILNNMNVDKQIMSLFYRSIVESVMSYCIISWFGSSHKKDQHKLAKIGKIAKRMGVNSKNLNELYQNDCINMVDKILKDAHHPLYNFMYS